MWYGPLRGTGCLGSSMAARRFVLPPTFLLSAHAKQTTSGRVWIGELPGTKELPMPASYDACFNSNVILRSNPQHLQHLLDEGNGGTEHTSNMYIASSNAVLFMSYLVKTNWCQPTVMRTKAIDNN